MFICVLSSPPDADDIPYDPSSYLTRYKWEHITPTEENYATLVETMLAKGVDVFLNLCDGTPDDDISGIGLVSYLEKRNAAFTGAGSAFFDPSRQEMKAAAQKAGVPFPGSFFINNLADLGQFDHQLLYPLLVKPAHGYASVGLSRSSKVDQFSDLEIQVEKTLSRFGGALIEEFIVGREFTVLVAENPDDRDCPVAFQPVEFVFPKGESFKHYDIKWKDYESMSVKPVCDQAISETLCELTRKQFLAMNGNGYARCDFRMNNNGDIFLLEINPNCGVFYPPNEPGSADFILLNDPRGHDGFLDLILASALKRKQTARQF